MLPGAAETNRWQSVPPPANDRNRYKGNGHRACCDRLFRVGKRKSRFPSQTRLSSALGESPALAARHWLFMTIEIAVSKAWA